MSGVGFIPQRWENVHRAAGAILNIFLFTSLLVFS